MVEYKEKMEIVQKYLKKRSKRVGGKYREALRTISQVKMVSAKSLRNIKLFSQGCEVGFHLEVLSSQLAAYIGQL